MDTTAIPENLEAIISDVDGVLVDSMSFHAQAWKTSFKEAGIDIEKEEIYILEGSNHIGIIEKIFEKQGMVPTEEDLEQIHERKKELFFKNQKAYVFDGMDETFKSLQTKFKLAVVSGSDRAIVETLMGKFYPKIFNTIIAGTDVKKGKPDPEPYLTAVQRLAVKKNKCIVLENAPLGVEAAKNAGLFCIAVPTYVSADHLNKADIVVRDHRELVEHLCSLLD
ncbi:HAD family phosphatase [Methanohalophilus sp. RSK]|uniref:HAD family hydrolase n=1 Tax=Methanohalophilus sp. RSK TaxID=2485783 RepID=UPI000F43C776|nr:HAD family phosphatase [Methanohalophilus sp. RSK]RNI12017.1 HAD family phosphatase [Methanohalophilus sp. RSK]